MTSIYPADELSRFDRQARRFLTGGIGALAVCLAGCAAVCTQVRPLNAGTCFMIVIGLNTLGGWAMILLVGLGYRDARAECRHLRHLGNGNETEEAAGRLRTDAHAAAIPGGIPVLGVRLEAEDGPAVRLRVNARKRALLPPDGALVRVISRKGYITAFEVLHEAD